MMMTSTKKKCSKLLFASKRSNCELRYGFFNGDFVFLFEIVFLGKCLAFRWVDWSILMSSIFMPYLRFQAIYLQLLGVRLHFSERWRRNTTQFGIHKYAPWYLAAWASNKSNRTNKTLIQWNCCHISFKWSQ